MQRLRLFPQHQQLQLQQLAQVRRPVLSLARLLIYFTAPTTSTPAFVYGNYYNWKCGGNEYRYKRRLPVLFDGLCHHSQWYSNHCPLPKILVLGRHSVDKKLPDYQHGWQRLCWLRFRHNQQLPNIRAALSSCTVLSLCRKIQLHPTHSLPIFAYNLHRRFPGKPESSDLMWGYQGKAVFEKVLIFLNGVSQWASANIC